MIKYVFKEDFVAIKNAAKANPQKIGEFLASVAEKHGGALRPDDVVAEAQNPRCPAHKHFEWNDTVAAHAYRKDQARELIRVVRVLDEEEVPQRAFLSVSDKDGVAYRPLEQVLTSHDLQLQVMKQALRDIAAFERRYSDLEDICALVRVARDRLEAWVGVVAPGAEARAQ